MIVGVLLVVGSLVAARGLFGLGSLSAPALLPAPDALAAAWGRAWNPIPGAPSQIPPPWLALMALGSTILLGQPEWLVTLLLCGVVPLALIAVYPVLRSVIADRRVRLWAAANYALLPVWLGGTNQGRLSLSVVAILLPMLILALRALALRRPRVPEAWRGGWGAGVVLVGLAAFEPSILIFAVIIAVVAAVRLRRTPRKIGRIGLALALPLLVLLPWLPSLIAAPGRLLVGPDAAATAVSEPPAVWALLLGRETGPGLPPLWLGAVLFGVIWAAALLGPAPAPTTAAGARVLVDRGPGPRGGRRAFATGGPGAAGRHRGPPVVRGLPADRLRSPAARCRRRDGRDGCRHPWPELHLAAADRGAGGRAGGTHHGGGSRLVVVGRGRRPDRPCESRRLAPVRSQRHDRVPSAYAYWRWS